MKTFLTFLNTYFIPLVALIPALFLVLALTKRYIFQRHPQSRHACYISNPKFNLKKIIALIFSILGLILGFITFFGNIVSEMYWVAVMLICGGGAEWITPTKPDFYLTDNQFIINKPTPFRFKYTKIRRLYLYTSGIFIVLETGKHLEYSFNLTENQELIQQLRHIAQNYRQIHFMDTLRISSVPT